MSTGPTRIRQLWLPFILLLSCMITIAAFLPRVQPEGRTSWHMGEALRVGAPEPVRQATVISPYGPGFEYELVETFCGQTPCRPEWVSVHSKEEGLDKLRHGEIDLLVGFWGDAPEPEATGETAHTAALPEITGGKAYAHFNPVRIQGMAAPDPKTPEDETKGRDSAFDTLARAVSSLMPMFASTSDDASEHPPFPVFSYSGEQSDDSAKGALLLDPASYALWLPFMGDVGTERINSKTPYRWFWRSDDLFLAGSLEDFWKHPDRKGELAELTERYFGFLPRTLRQRDILELADTLAASLPEYQPFILKASRETGVPPLLLVAVIYQESRFDPHAVSETKVRGIMQLTTATARMLDVDRKNPEECIMGGARYLRDLYDRIGDKAATEWDRWFMALAAYNQGMSNLNRTIKLSRELGGKGDVWADLKRAFPLSTTCRGLEAKSFVERIRYYHFVLHGLIALAPAETQHFAPLLGLALSDASL